MFALLWLFSLICLLGAMLGEVRFCKNKIRKTFFRVLLCTLLSAAIFALMTDTIFFFRGGICKTEKITLSQTEITDRFGFMTVNGIYRSVGSHFKKQTMIFAESANNTEIRTVDFDKLLKTHAVSFWYLPFTKFILKMEVALTDANAETKTYDIFRSANASMENTCIFCYAVFTFFILLYPCGKR